MTSGGPFPPELFYDSWSYYFRGQTAKFSDCSTKTKELFLAYFFPSCGSNCFLHFLLLFPWRVIMQVWLTGNSRVEEKFYEKWNCHGKLGNTLFPSTSTVKNQEESQGLRWSFRLPMPIFGAALAPSAQGEAWALCTVDGSVPLPLSWHLSSHTHASPQPVNLSHVAWLDHSRRGSFSKYSHGTKSHPGVFPESP